MNSPPHDSPKPAAAAPLLAFAGFLIAAFSAMCGIGGGIFGVPVLYYVFRLPLRASVATSLALVAASTSTATISEVLHPKGAIHWATVALLIASSLIGAQIGYWISRRISTTALKVVFLLVLGYVGMRLILTGPGNGGSSAEVVDLGLWHYGFVVAAGLIAGIVVPLLGVGGGLIVVPALLLGVPGMGYLGARACSMAMAMVTSGRSLLLYLREGMVHLPTARWFALGAALGAGVGVWLVHLEGAALYGRTLLGATLCLAALRFGLDVVRAVRASTTSTTGC